MSFSALQGGEREGKECKSEEKERDRRKYSQNKFLVMALSTST